MSKLFVQHEPILHVLNNMSCLTVNAVTFKMFRMCIVTVIQAVNRELPCGFTAYFFFFFEQQQHVLHNSVGGGTVQSAKDHLYMFFLLQPHLHVHAVMFTQEASAKHMTNTTTPMNGLAVINLQLFVYSTLSLSALWWRCGASY